MDLNFEKYADGLIPAIVQDAQTHKVLMLGFMNDAAFKKTEKAGRVTFYSRSRNKLWTKGETSGNFLAVKEISIDCDADTILIKA
ncbi:MAG: phosphoribosyl-AMP cyclohydrolase, partial [Pyrinomonadaceae bacterium]